MQSIKDCFFKVKSDCFKYISSQETKDQKFKNNRDQIFHSMANRFAKKVGQVNVKKILFFDNEKGDLLVET